MLTESPSKTNRLHPQGTSNQISLSEETTPLKAAMAAANTFIVMLHPKLQQCVKDLIGGVLQDASKFHYKNEKLNKVSADNDYFPMICQDVGMVLQDLVEVQKTTCLKSFRMNLSWKQRHSATIGHVGVCSLFKTSTAQTTEYI